jgi:hypothetical protein
MLRRIREECDVDYVIVHKVDRLARSRTDDVQIVLSLRQAGATLVSATENIDETPSGTLLHAIMAAVAEFYTGNLALEAKKDMTKRRSSVGYRNTRDRVDGKDIGTVVLDEPRATHIRWAFKTFALGQHTLRQLAEELTDRGFTMLATVRLPERPASIQNCALCYDAARRPWMTSSMPTARPASPTSSENQTERWNDADAIEPLTSSMPWCPDALRRRAASRKRVHGRARAAPLMQGRSPPFCPSDSKPPWRNRRRHSRLGRSPQLASSRVRGRLPESRHAGEHLASDQQLRMRRP